MHFSVEAAPRHKHSELFTFGVSPITHGVVPTPPLQRPSSSSACEMIGANHLNVVERRAFYTCWSFHVMRRMMFNSAENKKKPPRGISDCGYETSLWTQSGEYSAMNHRWLVLHDPRNTRVVIGNLLLEPSGLGATTPLEIPMPERVNVVNVFMNQSRHDEAVLASMLPDAVELCIFNVAMTWFDLQCTQVASRTGLPPGTISKTCSIPKVLVLQTESKERSFVVMVYDSKFILLQFRECTSGSHEINTTVYNFIEGSVALSQLNKRLFCVSCPHRVEIWDCNSPSRSLRIVDHVEHCQMAIAHSGLLFHMRDDHCIVVTDYDSGSTVITLETSLAVDQIAARLYRPVDFSWEEKKRFHLLIYTMDNNRGGWHNTIASIDFVLQFVALCTMGHSRCGRDTPLARVLPLWDGVSASSVARLVWEWASVCPTMHFSVEAVRMYNRSTLFTFGVSPITHGVVHTPPLQRPSSSVAWELVGANHLNVVERDGNLESFRVLRRLPFSASSSENREPPRRGISGHVTALRSQSWGGHSAMNHRWLVLHDTRNMKVVIGNLLLEPSGLGGTTPLEMRMPERVNVVNVFMNQSCHDEAVLASMLPDAVELCIFNVAMTWFDLQCPQTLSRTAPTTAISKTCSIPKVLVLQTESKERTFVVMVYDSKFILLQFRECTSGSHATNTTIYNFIEGSVALSQLNERLFCVSCPHRVEIWDCNSPSRSLRIVEHIFPCKMAIAHGGFLFHMRDDHCIVVTDYDSGSTVITLYLSHFAAEERIGRLFSFML
ncbi:hypothetical protein Pelo_17756 [Pelomyxa schiedti]|nr:hypothetical protein Pelo_17756 [Pelomyxa schiedti]